MNKSLIYFFDSEGGMTRMLKYHNIWNIGIIFHSVVDIDVNNKHITNLTPVLGSHSFTHSKGASKADIMEPLKIFVDAVESSIDLLEVNNVIAVCWNKHHEKTVLEPFFRQCKYPITLLDGADIYKQIYVDTLDNPFGRQKYSISHLMERFDYEAEQKHTAIGDTLDMMNVLACSFLATKGSTRDTTVKNTVKSKKAKNVINDIILSKQFETVLFEKTKFVDDIGEDQSGRPIERPVEGPIERPVEGSEMKAIEEAIKEATKKVDQTNHTIVPSKGFEILHIDGETYEIKKGWKPEDNHGYGMYKLSNGDRKYCNIKTKNKLLEQHCGTLI